MKSPKHAPMNQFPVIEDCLQVGGRAITDIAMEAGGAPFYVYDRQLMTKRMAEMRSSLPNGLIIKYAIKANPMPAVVQHMSSLVDGLDVASAGELRVALDSGFDPINISFAGPGKMDWELKQAIAAGATLNLESENEMERAALIGDQLGIQPHVAVRVNPEFELKSSGVKMGGGPKAFGVDSERVPAMLQRLGELNLDFRGFHIYCGSQNLSAESIIDAQNKTIDLGYRLAEHAPQPISTFNIGGGFGIPLFPGENRLELEPIAENLEIRMRETADRLPTAKIAIELGRYLVGEAGLYVCEVVDRKISRGEVFIITNGGLHQHLAASGNFGQVLRKNFPVVVANRVVGQEREVANVVGPLCTPLDILAAQMELTAAHPGDLIGVYQSGAYGYSTSPIAFLGHPPPAQILV
ncbi:MAG: pyridoxal-dependent decarboxylase, exosortase A system-associated [Halioglobus sp.]|jgi:diaminopimelate decarboxylase|nr:pyridoxal-dependent decarboxylase, exosortase A system-associated [Halioglobus sp.]